MDFLLRRRQSNKVRNCKRAIKGEKALKVYTFKRFPIQYIWTQNRRLEVVTIWVVSLVTRITKIYQKCE